MIGVTVGEWIGGAFCIGFPGWVVLVVMFLIRFVPKPADAYDPDRQHGFPVPPVKPEKTAEKSAE